MKQMEITPKRKKIKEDIWDVSIYTDDEIIHNLLNMSNPTDRELEIKIWSTVQQYKSTTPTPETVRWIKFYEDIYHRLFSFSEEEEEEEEEVDVEHTTEEQTEENKKVTYQPKLYNIEPLQNNNDKNTSDNVKKNEEEEPEIEPKESTKLVTQLQYATGNVNPLLKETISRVLTIDSQYRDNKNEPTTNFLLNLTETIKNVVSIKLYSLHIPFTWYTISKNYGSNYFYIKGLSPGINDGNHDFQITIPAGNYTQTTLASAINTSFQSLAASRLDICFGTTNIEYNPINSIMTMTIDIQNIFNQTYYYLSFPTNPLNGYTKPPNLTDPSYINLRKSTIPSFLGFKDLSYGFNIIASNTFVNTNSTSSNYIISNITDISNHLYPNNQLWIYQYQSGTGIFNPSSSTILATYSITIPVGNYSRTSLTTTINQLIQQANFLNISQSSFNQIAITDSSNAYIQLKIQLNRNTTTNQENINTVIFLPDDTLNNDIWAGACFQFIPQYPSITINPNQSTTPLGNYFPFYTNELYSELPTLQTNYIIDSSASIIFTCITPYYDILLNNYILKMTASNGTGYILPDYISAVNDSFKRPINIATGLDGSANQIFNTTINTPFFIGNDSVAYFNLDMNISFNQDKYSLDVTDSPLNTVLNLGNSYGYYQTTFNLIDLSSNQYRIDFSFNQSAVYDMSCSVLMTIYPNVSQNAGNKNAPAFIIEPVYTNNNDSRLYNNLTLLQLDIESALINYTDVILNTNPIQNTKVVINTNLQSGYYYTGYIQFSIVNTLTETNYSMAFYDPNLSWSDYLYMNDNGGSQITTDVSYILSQYHVSGQAYSEIYGSNVVLNEIIDISYNNNTFSIVPLSSSDSLQSSDNFYEFTVPNGSYTRDQLITQMNLAFKSNKDTYYTNIGLKTIKNTQYCYLYGSINKVFTSSDYQLLFYDSMNFQQCSLGVTNTGNASWDSTLGWILGFRKYTTYNLTSYITTPSNPPSQLNNISTIIADTTCSTTLFNYFILTLDDFNQNHTNDGLVTITTVEKSIPLPAYANRSDFICDPSSGLYLYTGITQPGTNSLTQNQIYSITEIMNNAVNANTLEGNVPISKYSYGPFISDVLAIIPVKTAGVINGQTLIFDSGTLQTQSRQYFGPINLNRLSVTLYDDKGHVVNLNNSNWSFTLLVDQIYKKSAASS
jgi:hypothetical protein